MIVRFGCVIATIALGLTIGCHGGKQDLPVSEALEDSTESFVFAESSLLDIDSEMMSEKLATIQLPGAVPRIDSVTAMKAVYLILADTLLVREAEDFDLESESPTLYGQYLDLRRDRILRQMYLEIIAESVVVTDSSVRAAYEERKESFYIPDRYRARHIVISGEGLRYSDDSLRFMDMTVEARDSAAYERLAEIRQRLLAGENFDTLAMLYSQDEKTSGAGGDLGYLQLQQMVPPFDSTVEHTDIGEISGIIETKYGWHVVRVDDFDSAHYQPLDSVYQQLESSVREQMLMEQSRLFLDSLRESANMVYDTAALSIPDSLHTDRDILAFVNPDDTINGGDTLYFADYNRLAPHYRSFNNIEGELSLDAKTEILRNAAVKPLLMQTARTLGYLEHPSIVAWTKKKLIQYSSSVLRSRLLEPTREPTDEEMRAYYESHLDDYQIERPVSIQHIVFEDSAIAEYVRDLLLSGVDFMEMVDKYYPGDPDIKRAASDLGAIGPDDMPQSFYRVAMKTPVGSISHPVKTKYGYHLIKVLARSHSMDYEQASIKIRPLLKQHYQRENLRRYVESQIESPPKIHWQYLDRLHFPRRGPRPEPLPSTSGANE